MINLLSSVFADDFATTPTSQRHKEKFETLYVTGGGPMTTFLGPEVEQSDDGISLHLDTYVQELI